MLLWQEYKEREPSGYQYSQFCDLFRRWQGKLDLSMCQEHRAGEKMFVDYCGQTLPILDRLVHNAYKVELKGEFMRKKRAESPSI